METYNAALNEYGLKVIQQFDTKAEFDTWKETATDLEYGDAVLVGADENPPFITYIWTRANIEHPTDYWFNAGQFPLPGPQGAQGQIGPQGSQGTRGPGWFSGVGVPFPNPNLYINNDLYFQTNTSDIYKYFAGQWTLIANIQGAKGEQGNQGDRGTSGTFKIAGIIPNTGSLPTPAAIGDLSVVYLIGSVSPYTLYIQVGDSSSTAVWRNAGAFNVGTFITVGGQYVDQFEMDSKANALSMNNVVYANDASGQLSGVHYGNSVSDTNAANAIVQRKANKNIESGTPTTASEVATKGYVDANAGGSMYMHQIKINLNNSYSSYVFLIIYSSRSIAYTSLDEFPYNTSAYTAYYPISGYIANNGDYGGASYLYIDNMTGKSYTFYFNTTSGNEQSYYYNGWESSDPQPSIVFDYIVKL